MKNSIPYSVLILDENNNITNLNKKAEELLSLHHDTAIGVDITSLDLLKKERIQEKIKQFNKDKKPVSINSISFRNNRGDVCLTNISQLPLINEKGLFKGSIVVFDDVSKTEEIKAELIRKQSDLKAMDIKFKDVFTRLKVANEEKNAIDDHLLSVGKDKQIQVQKFNKLLEEKQKELEKLNTDLSSKNNELEGITTRLNENRATLETVENELSKRRTELNVTPQSDEALSKIWREKLKIYDEIDKSLGPAEEDIIKTKKIQHETELEER
jgi:PAS domain S-box-containing protein